MFYISSTFSTLKQLIVDFGDALEFNLFIVFTRTFSFAKPLFSSFSNSGLSCPTSLMKPRKTATVTVTVTVCACSGCVVPTPVRSFQTIDCWVFTAPLTKVMFVTLTEVCWCWESFHTINSRLLLLNQVHSVFSHRHLTYLIDSSENDLTVSQQIWMSLSSSWQVLTKQHQSYNE